MSVELEAEGAPVDVGLFERPEGGQSICVFVKRTYEFADGRRMYRSTRGELPLFTEPVEEDGEGREPVACLVHESDLAPRKLCTDVVVHGRVHAPGRVPCERTQAGVRVGEHSKWFLAFGDRRVRWRPGCRPAFDRPRPFAELPLSWRRAYGGIDATLPPVEIRDTPSLLAALDPEQHPGAHPRNPAGVGWCVNADPRALAGLALPNFEDPEHLLSPERLVAGSPERWARAPVPVGLGWISQTWFPRSSLLGIGPDLPPPLRRGWLSQPLDADHRPDPRFFNGASEGLRLWGLRGDEPLTLVGLCPEGALSTALPADPPRIEISVERSPLATTRRLHTVEIYVDDSHASLLWVAEAHAPSPLPRSLPLEQAATFDLFEGVDVLVDGLALNRQLFG